MADDSSHPKSLTTTNGDVVQGTAPETATTSQDAELVKSPVEDIKDVEMPDAQDEVKAPAKSDDVASIDQEKAAQNTESTAEQIELNTEQDVSTADGQENSNPEAESAASKAKAQPRRKSGGVPEHKKKLNKKASKANLTHTDAKPGDHFFARLKGFPPWPVVICDEEMLPSELIKSRPVTAAREDGTYRDENADGGSKVKDRTFPIMYLYTNEFGWIKNTDLHDLDFETVGTVLTKTRKDLQAAHQLAAEHHDLDYYKDVLKTFMEHKEAELLAKQEAAEAKEAKAAEAKEAKEAKAAKAKSSKASKSQKVAKDDDDNDIDMAEGDSEGASSGSKKRKADDEAIASHPSDVKKVKLALKFKAPQTPNGTSSSKSAKETPASKSAKPKQKKEKATPKTAVAETATPQEPELNAEEKRAKKEKEILFLRHKLQKGLLTRDQPPRAEEMKSMSEFISKLEGYSDLEVSIIRTTKINKVLKAIIKLSSIPKEDEFSFKSRSQTLLDKWNKLLAGEQTTPAAATNGTVETKSAADEKSSVPNTTNGADKETATKTEVKDDENIKEEQSVEASTSEGKDVAAVPKVEPSATSGQTTKVEEKTETDDAAA